MEGLFPHPPNAVYPMSPTTPFLPLPDNSQYPNQMDYFGDYASLYPTSSAREEPNTYQPTDQTLATGGADNQLYNYTFTDLWNMPEQSGSVVDESTNLLATTSHESLAPATSYVNQADGYGQPSYPNNYWPEFDQMAQSYHSGSLNKEFSFDNTVVSEPSTVIPAPSSVPFNYRGENQSGPSTSTFHTENVFTYHQPCTGPARAGMTRFHPYGRSYARRSEHRNAEAGPSTLLPAPVPYVGYPTLQPSGGMISETTADAKKAQPNTEEDKAPAEPKRTRRPRGEGPPRHHRVRMGGYTAKLSNWAQRELGLQEEEAPIFNEALAAAVAAIKAIRVAVYSESQLARGESIPKTNSKNAIAERHRRDVGRELYGELSRYYLLKPGQNTWTRPPLLLRALEDLENTPTPPGPSDQPPP